MNPLDLGQALRAELAHSLREQLQTFAQGLACGEHHLHQPAPASVARGEGHFHLAPELFLQLSGWTRFKLPQGECSVGPGEALLMPARLLHHEVVGPASDGTPFRNLVIYADARVLTCHLAHEQAPGQPGILHLEAVQHPQAERVLSWLGDAATTAATTAAVRPDDAAILQARALVLAAITGVRRALDEATDTGGPAEPPLIAQLRVLVKNQLGDHTLSVRRLAEQSGCSADYLSHLFRQVTGEQLIANINRQRMERAARLLRDTSLAGKEVAWACGFAAQSYFIRTFRAHHGMTPKTWRESLRSPGPM